MSYEYQHVKVARVIDGDTVVLDIDMGNRITWSGPFRLAGINAPEMGTTGGDEAWSFLFDLLKGGVALAETIKPDKYGRWLVRLYTSIGLDGVPEGDVGEAMIEAGHAVAYMVGNRGLP